MRSTVCPSRARGRALVLFGLALGSLGACARDARSPESEHTLAPASEVTTSGGAAPTASAPTTTAVTEPSPPGGETSSTDKVPDIEYVPTPQNVVDKMLEVAKVTKNDVLYDLGCGDGRIVITAAKRFGVKAFGFDVDPQRIKESNENAKNAGVENLVKFEKKDVFTVDLSPATVVTMYLLPELNVRLMPQLEKLRAGSRIVSHDFDMEGAEWEKWWTVIAKDHRTPNDREHYVYLWKTPLKKQK